MKTITEFSGFQLKDAFAKRQALVAEGKTEEELPAAFNEAMKFDEAKANLYKNAVSLLGKDADRVKRIIVAAKTTEDEKPTDGFKEIEGHFFKLELFAGAPAPVRGNDRDFGGRGGKGGRDKKGGRGRDNKGPRGPRENNSGDRPAFGDRPARPRRDDRPTDPSLANAPAAGKTIWVNPRGEGVPGPIKPAEPRKPRAPRGERPARGDRPARGPRTNQGPKGAGELRLVLKGQTPQTFIGTVSPTDATTASAVVVANETAAAPTENTTQN